MAKCPSCGTNVNASDKRCSKCGAKLDNQKSSNSTKLLIGIIAVVVILAVVGALASGVFNNNGTNDVSKDSSSNAVSPVNEDKTNNSQSQSQSSSSDNSSSSAGTEYWASAKTDKFHLPTCEWAQKISDNNKIVYNSREDAIAHGKEPCSVCNP